jgi:hypothetical protein
MQIDFSWAAFPDRIFPKRNAMNPPLESRQPQRPILRATVAARTHRKNLWGCGYGRVNAQPAFHSISRQADELAG